MHIVIYMYHSGSTYKFNYSIRKSLFSVESVSTSTNLDKQIDVTGIKQSCLMWSL
jgi:hypothetical protein